MTEMEALKEMDRAFSQIKEEMHIILNIEQKHGFLTNAQHNIIFDDANGYDDMQCDVLQRNTQSSKQNKSSENAPMISNNIIDEDDNDLYAKNISKRKSKLFSFDF